MTTIAKTSKAILLTFIRMFALSRLGTFEQAAQWIAENTPDEQDRQLLFALWLDATFERDVATIRAEEEILP